jgi:hypothetical protein
MIICNNTFIAYLNYNKLKLKYKLFRRQYAFLKNSISTAQSSICLTFINKSIHSHLLREKSDFSYLMKFTIYDNSNAIEE